jgi:branched-chain amino acid transport system substrate-binding protein
VFKSFVDANILAVGALAGPRQYAGAECNPNGFFVSFTNDDWPAAAGLYMTNQGYKRVFFLAADYQAGKEHIEAAIKYFKGQAIGPVYTPLSQLDFAPEIARIRAEKPDAVFSFLVGAGGIAFSKQYSQGGLMGQIPFITEDPVANPLTFPAQGDAALGIVMATNWHIGLDNAANKKFVGTFRAKYNRDPATFAALGYDAVKAIDGAVRGVNGEIENKDALRASMRKANFDSVRGKFKFNNNQFPIQDLFMMEVAKDANGGLTSKLKEVVIKDWQDPLHTQCPMK